MHREKYFMVLVADIFRSPWKTQNVNCRYEGKDSNDRARTRGRDWKETYTHQRDAM
jgi:hypothetical protein